MPRAGNPRSEATDGALWPSNLGRNGDAIKKQPVRTRLPGIAYAALAGAATLAIILAAAGCGPSAAAAGPPVPPSAIGRLTAIAHRAATVDGDQRPAWITVVMTTRAKALTSAPPVAPASLGPVTHLHLPGGAS